MLAERNAPFSVPLELQIIKFAFLSELNASGITVVIVTHEPKVARQTERILWFRDGQGTLKSDTI